MFKDFDYIASVDFPETAEYIEKEIPNTVDSAITYAGAIDFKFRPHVDSRGNVYPIPGLRTNKHKSYVIETKSEVSFKSGDILRFSKNDKAKYTVRDVDNYIDKRNEQEYMFTNQDWPGMAGDALKIKLITLE